MKFELNQVSFGNSDISRGLVIPAKSSCELAEETGLHLGDGSMNFYKERGFYQLRGDINADRNHYELTIRPLYKRLYNLDVHLRDMPSDSVLGFQIWSQALVTFKAFVLNMPLGFKRDFDIPQFILENEEYKRSFIRGVFDTDGTLYLEKKNGSLYPRLEITTISNLFAQRIFKILKSLAFQVTLGGFPGRGARFPTYRISCRGKTMLNKWMIEISPHNQKFIDKYNFFLNSCK